jgi:hypothetical protein
MAAVKAYFYKLREDMPDVCEGVDISRYIKTLCTAFNKKAIGEIDPAAQLPGGPVYYSDAPRKCLESSAKHFLEDAISDCLRKFDKKGLAKKALAEKIADKIVSDNSFREELIANGRVPQSWAEFLKPADPEQKLDKKAITEALAGIQDRNFSHPDTKGRYHPLAKMTESKAFSDQEKLAFAADYLIGRERKGEAPWALRIGGRNDYREFNRARWLEQNGAYVLSTVGDILRLQENFTASSKLKPGAAPELPQLEPGALKLEIK